ncbi:response regulator [Altererythrobacter sp. KTW20L]|uniref:response regulator n=1 Tax=Altererythrobacter sp. KTW20L TaxID=2942210 RepID=UPI0020C06EC4|nr:response regulator [Altererythrobacter sp. KTW20L]MCL6250831.1 response regulator [Altererythrobacter sp. KTW20L]
MCHVLIIEDNFLIAEYLGYLAKQAGATSIASACTEAEAVRAAREQQPRIIFSDVGLRAGTGPYAVRTIRAELGEIPVIFITGSPEFCEQCKPPVAILTKPVDGVGVTEAFRRLIPSSP